MKILIKIEVVEPTQMSITNTLELSKFYTCLTDQLKRMNYSNIHESTSIGMNRADCWTGLTIEI